LHAPRVEVEVHLGGGLPNFSIVGLPATAVKESKDRVRAALANSGFEWPAGRITVNLSPADLPKEGCRYDLPIALGILLASAQISMPQQRLENSEFYGELGLAGELRPIKGVLLAAAHAAREHRGLIVPVANLGEARIAASRSDGADSLLGVCAIARVDQRDCLADNLPCLPMSASGVSGPDLADVRGQAAAKRALIIAAAGGHSLLFVGPPGTGKSMLAQRMPGLLPPLAADEALDVAAIASVSSRGFTPTDFGRRPFRSPHHTASASAIIGGGPQSRPGEVSLAHRGVLFLDELPEFNRSVLESLREPLESGVVAISRAARQVEYPARFQLIAAMNPCRCGRAYDPGFTCKRGANVRCAADYQARLSGPLLDRIDLHIEVAAVSAADLVLPSPAEGSREVAARVKAAREIQAARFAALGDSKLRVNAEAQGKLLERIATPDSAALKLLRDAADAMRLSARGYHRVLKVARTIADLDGSETIGRVHLAEALAYRALNDRMAAAA
jgi:magnesium chelatase family protein